MRRSRHPKNLTKKIDETRNCLLEKIKQNDLISEKHKNVFTLKKIALNDFEHFLIFISDVSGSASISAFDSLNGVSVGIGSEVLRVLQ